VAWSWEWRWEVIPIAATGSRYSVYSLYAYKGTTTDAESVKDFEPHFLRARRAGLKVSLHFAENKGWEEEHEAILAFRPERLGHAVFMSQHTCERLLASRIPVEVW
jgi:adenosine deaminase